MSSNLPENVRSSSAPARARRGAAVRGLLLAAACAAVLAAPRAAAAEGKVISEVRFRGLVSLDPDVLRRVVATRPGNRYRSDIVGRDILRLEHYKVFEMIGVATEETADGLVVVFNVQERPVVRSIKVEGARQVNPGRVLGAVTRTKVGERYDPARSSFDAYDALEMLRKRAYTDAKVRVGAVPMEGPGVGRPAGVRVIFDVDEGTAVRVKEVLFEGNKALSDRELLKLVEVRAKRWYNAGAVKDWQLEWDAARVRAALRDKGRLDAAVSAAKSDRFKCEKGHTWINVAFKIEEGPEYKVGSVSVSGNELVSKEQILATMKLGPGEVYSETGRMSDARSVFGIYGDMGRVFTDVSVAMKLAEKPATVDLSVRIKEGEVVRIREIEPLGNTKTRDIVILREMQLDPGDTFDWTKYRDSVRRLYRLDYFSKVIPHIQPTDSPSEADIIVEVEEKLTGMFQAGIAFSSNDEIMGNIELSQRNFDLWDWPKSWRDFWSGNALVGDGQKLGLSAAWGSTRRSFSVEWVEPWLFNRPVRLDVKLYDRLKEYGDYDEARAGARLGLGKRWKNDWAVSLAGEIQNVRIDDIDPSVDPLSPIRDELGLNRINSMALAISYNSRDSFLFPTQGMLFRISEEVAGGPFSGDKDFMRHSALISGHIPIGWKARERKMPPPVLSLRIRGDWAIPYGDSDSVPVYERLFAGGIGTIRGFDYRTVSPRFPDLYGDEVGGEFRLLETAELTFPLGGEDVPLRGALFFDMGNVWADPSDFDIDDQKKAWGFGLIILIPAGAGGFPFKIYWGYPISPEDTDDVERVSFTFGSFF